MSATTTASTSEGAGALGTPIICTVRIPPRTSIPARSVDPVKSSPMQPSNSNAMRLSYRFVLPSSMQVRGKIRLAGGLISYSASAADSCTRMAGTNGGTPKGSNTALTTVSTLLLIAES